MGIMHLFEVVQALRQLQLPLQEHQAAGGETFLPEVWLDRGVIHYTPRVQVGDLLHEAGHFAVIPPSFRGYLRRGSVESEGKNPSLLVRKIEEYMKTNVHPDEPVTRALLQAGECEAIAWSYAAAVHIGYDALNIFTHTYPGLPQHRQPFQGEGKDLFHSVKAGAYFGVHGLHHAGMCNRKQWPVMKKWLQDAA